MLDLKVPNVNERVPMQAIQTVADRIAEKFQPERIILFGSYAYGDPKPWSDVDLLVVMDTPEGDFKPAWDIYRALSPHPFAMDILVRSDEEIRRRIAIGDWFLEDIATKGKILYERDNRRMDRQLSRFSSSASLQTRVMKRCARHLNALTFTR